MPIPRDVIRNAKQPVLRISRGRFAPEKSDEIRQRLADSAAILAPVLRPLRGLLYFHAGIDAATSTVVNVSVWVSEEDARQMDTLAPMLEQRNLLQAAGVTFDKNANYEPAWKIEGEWSFPAGQRD